MLNTEKKLTMSINLSTFAKRIPLTENSFQKGKYCLIFKSRNNMK